jgi:DNA-binding transcriptional MerR regulator
MKAERGHTRPGYDWTEGAQVGWAAGQVAVHLGIGESTLRSWHRRYGLEPRLTLPSGHRRYGVEDVLLLTRMCELVDAGLRPSAAAELLRSTTPLGDACAAAVEAAKRLDTTRCADVLTRAVRGWGVVRTWDRVCRPAMTSVERAQRDDPGCIADEHALSWAIATSLHRVHRPSRDASVLLACAPGEQHSLPVDALAAALAERGVSARVLGASLPLPALVSAVRATTPASVLLWSHRTDPAHHAAAAAVMELGTRLLVAGPGWRPPVSGVGNPGTLAEAVAMVGAAAAGPAGVDPPRAEGGSRRPKAVVDRPLVD